LMWQCMIIPIISAKIAFEIVLKMPSPGIGGGYDFGEKMIEDFIKTRKSKIEEFCSNSRRGNVENRSVHKVREDSETLSRLSCSFIRTDFSQFDEKSSKRVNFGKVA